ncbi:MAG: VapE domain-containing protein [Bacilli bacterium]
MAVKTIEELKLRSNWLNWIYRETKDGKPTKVPYSPLGGKSGTSDEYKHTWTDFQTANNKNSNVGIVFRDGLCGIDIDEGATEKDTKEIIDLMNSYTEKSPSGNGYHILFTCDISKIPYIKEEFDIDTCENSYLLDDNYYQKNEYKDLECYIGEVTNRFFTYTGNVVKDLPINDRTEELMIFLNKYMIRPKTNKTISIILKSKSKEKFEKLYFKGDIKDYNNDDSSADMALCSLLAFFTNGNFEEIDELFSQSALYREKWDRYDYKKLTINKAIDLCGNEYYKSPGRPKGNVSPNKKEDFSIEILEEYLKEKNLVIRYNEITKNTVIIGYDKKHSQEHIIENLPTIIYNDMKSFYNNCNLNIIRNFLDVIETDNRYNPVLEKLMSLTWDKNDYFYELTLILKIDKFSALLLKKWLWQCCSMCQNNIDKPFGADGCLVLCGPQGYGKTLLVKLLGFNGKYSTLGQYLNCYNSDTIRRCSSNWIVELSEIESTLCSGNIELLKAFITNPNDKYRLPYARKDIDTARRTSLIGTCNNFEFLIDPTGSRRFWTIPLEERIDIERLREFNFEGLWAQMFSLHKKDLQGFRLNLDEQELLKERNSSHERTLAAEDEIIDIFSLEGSNIIQKYASASFFKENHSSLKNYTPQQIGKVLDKLGIKQKSRKVNGKSQRLRYLPVYTTMDYK